MAKDRTSVIDRHARDKLIALLESLLNGESKKGSLSRPEVYKAVKSRDKSVSQIHRELCDTQLFRLPLSPRDDLSELAEYERPTLERTVLFLRSDLTYQEPNEGWNWLIVLMTAGGITFFVLLIAVIATDGRVTDETHTLLWRIMLTGFAAWMGPLVVAYDGFLLLAGYQIFCVRVLRKDYSAVKPLADDYWPFLSREQYEAAGGAIGDQSREG